MSKSKKRKLKAAQPQGKKPATPAIHDRRTTDLTRNAKVAPVEIDDPMGAEPGDKLIVMRSLRDDPLAALHSAKIVDDCQFEAGRRWQRANQALEVGNIKAIDPTKEAVDGGQMADPVCEGVVRRDYARRDIERADAALGSEGAILIRDVLEREMTLAQAADHRGLNTETGRKYLGKRFRECLDTMAFTFGLTTSPMRGNAA